MMVGESIFFLARHVLTTASLFPELYYQSRRKSLGRGDGVLFHFVIINALLYLFFFFSELFFFLFNCCKFMVQLSLEQLTDLLIKPLSHQEFIFGKN